MAQSPKLSRHHVLELFPATEPRSELALGPAKILELLRDRGIELERRTLNRRLADLVSQGELITQGAGPALVYSVPKTPRAQLALSTSAEETRRLVSRPLETREGASFDPGFITDYMPNKDHFLPVETRLRLREKGLSALAGQPAGTYAREILGAFVVDLAWASSALEGNTYSLGDTRELLLSDKNANRAGDLEALMILNHRDALRYLVEHAETIRFNESTLLALHALLSDGLVSPRDGGRLRDRGVRIGESRYLPPSSLQRVTAGFHAILDKAHAIDDPYEQAFFALVMIPYLQPFVDVNKRTSRLAANIPFIRENLCPISFIGTPKDLYTTAVIGIYEHRRVDMLRDIFVHAYFVSCERYPRVAAAIEPPNPLRLKYRDFVKAAVHDVMLKPQLSGLAETLGFLRQRISPGEHEPLRRIVLEELFGLHHGNLARYAVSLREFQQWLASWHGDENAKDVAIATMIAETADPTQDKPADQKR